jgi:FkbM family methyltransferase
MIKKIIKKILFFLFIRENSKIKKLILNLLQSKIKLLDVGAAGGIHNRWGIIKDKTEVFCVEPHTDSALLLKENNKNINIIKKIFSNEESANLNFFYTKKEECSSVLEPNFNHINKYPDQSRFDIVAEKNFPSTTIDIEFNSTSLPDFIKIDVEGYALEILKGAKKSLPDILGMEVECEFFELRKNQSSFQDIQNFLKSFDFEFIDFLNIIRWERQKHSYNGQPQVADVLFLQKPELIINKFKKGILSEDKLLKYITILIIYNRSDLLWFINKNINEDVKKKYSMEKLFFLVEKKTNRLNNVKNISKFFENLINDHIKK